MNVLTDGEAPATLALRLMLTDALEILATSSRLCCGFEWPQWPRLRIMRGPYIEAMCGNTEAKVFATPEGVIDLKRQFGVHIARHRRLKGLSAVELARRVGITERQMTRIEQGEDMPRPKTQRRLIETLQLEMSELSKRPQDMTRSGRGRPPNR
jgi:DNA-binding XRE family transcriptional regulator